ncbi:MAG TPA: protoporphyrinogen oxidase, partial [Candidatus Nitrosotenuis sp.]|nr:protoporphyrinogen oxidase [Candidatus Nitrosotenuis sp.]
GPRYSLFYSLRQGLEAMVARLAERLPSGTILTGRAVQALRPPGEGQPWRLSGSGWEERADAVILALPVKDAARVADTFDPALAAELSGIRVASSATLNLLYDERQVRRLKAFGVVVPDIEQRSFFACTFSSLKYEGRAPAGSVLLRAFVGGMLRPEMAALPEDEVVARVRQDLGELLGVRGEPRTWWLCRHPDSMPQYEVGHLQRVERIEALEARHPGLALAGSAYRGVSVPDCVQSGRRAARQMAAYLSRLSPSESA